VPEKGHELLGKLETERRNPASAEIDLVSTIDMLRIVNREDQKVALAVEAEIPRIAEAVDAIAARARNGGRLFYIGAGTSGRLGVLDASECPPTFNVPYEMVQGIIAGGERALSKATEATEDSPEMGALDLMTHGFAASDSLVGIAASGRTPYVLGAVAKANELGAMTIGISCVKDSELSLAARIAIEPVVGPEILTGSTRMKAGTATKLVLNMLTTGMMIRLGMTYGNLMVNVQPKNVKLLDRARRIVEAATGVSAAIAMELLEASGRDVRCAILMGKRGVGRDEAEKRLAECGGKLAVALEQNG
jgi:N-acetylmuramic acid 6-phosphate etherase